jgi:hypothetical protein
MLKGPSENMTLVFRVREDGSRVVSVTNPQEIFFCECTQKVHIDDEELHKEFLCHSQQTQS